MANCYFNSNQQDSQESEPEVDELNGRNHWLSESDNGSPQMARKNVRVQLFRDPDPEGEETETTLTQSAALVSIADNKMDGNRNTMMDKGDKSTTSGAASLLDCQHAQDEEIMLQEQLQEKLQSDLQAKQQQIQNQVQQLQQQQQHLRNQEAEMKAAKGHSSPRRQLSSPRMVHSSDTGQQSSTGTYFSDATESAHSIPPLPVLDRSELQMSHSLPTLSEPESCLESTESIQSDIVGNTGTHIDRRVQNVQPANVYEDEQPELEKNVDGQSHSNLSNGAKMKSEYLGMQPMGRYRESTDQDGMQLHHAQQREGNEHQDMPMDDMSSIISDESEAELAALRMDQSDQSHAEGFDFGFPAVEAEEENQSEDAEADQFKLEPEADQSENYLGDFVGYHGQQHRDHSLAGSVSEHSDHQRGMYAQADAMADDSQPEGERGTEEAEGSEEGEAPAARMMFPQQPRHVPPPHQMHHLDDMRNVDGDGLAREVVGMEQNSNYGNRQLVGSQALRQRSAGYKPQTSRMPVTNIAVPSGARKKTIGGGSHGGKDSKTPKDSIVKTKQMSYPMMGSKVAARNQNPSTQNTTAVFQMPNKSQTVKNSKASIRNQQQRQVIPENVDDSELSIIRPKQRYVPDDSMRSTDSPPSIQKHLKQHNVNLSPIKKELSFRSTVSDNSAMNASILNHHAQQQQQKQYSPRKTLEHAALGPSDEIKHMELVRDQLRGIMNANSQGDTVSGIDESENVDDLLSGISTLGEDNMAYAMVGGKTLSDLAPNFGSLLQHSMEHQIPAHTQSGYGHQIGRPETGQIMAENQHLKESLEKEKYRRNHCEGQIQQLQGKILELQQQLTVAVSTDRKKELVIEQLDKTLARVVEDWRKRESEKQVVLQKCSIENKALRERQQQQQEVLSELESELQQTSHSLDEQKQRSNLVEQHLHNEQCKNEEEREHMEEQFRIEQDRLQSLQEDCQQLRENNTILESQVSNLEKALEEEHETWEEKEKEYLHTIDTVTQNHLKAMEDERVKQEQTLRSLREKERSLSTTQRDHQHLEIELDTAMREKESLKVQMGLLEAKMESSQRQMEADMLSQSEQKLQEARTEARSRQHEMEIQMHERHHSQMLELNQSHTQEMEQQAKAHREETRRIEKQHKQQLLELQEKVDQLEEDLSKAGDQQKLLESQREDVTKKLQSMMQTHCSEALRLLQMGSHVLALSPVKQGLLSPHQLAMNNSAQLSNTTQLPHTAQLPNTAQMPPTVQTSLSTALPSHPQARPNSAVNDQLHTSLSAADSGEQPVKQNDTSLPRPDLTVLSQSLDSSLLHSQGGYTPSSHPQPAGVMSSADYFTQLWNTALPTMADQQARPPPMTQQQGGYLSTTSTPQAGYPFVTSQQLGYPSATRWDIPTAAAGYPSLAVGQGYQAVDLAVAVSQPAPQMPQNAAGEGIMMAQSLLHSPLGQHHGQIQSQDSSYSSDIMSAYNNQPVNIPAGQPGAFLSSLLHTKPSGMSPQHDDPNQEPERLSEVEYSNISDKFDEHEARHQELQRYIKLLLDQPASSPGQSEDGQSSENGDPVRETRHVHFSPPTNQPPDLPAGVTHPVAFTHSNAASNDTTKDSQLTDTQILVLHQSPNTEKGGSTAINATSLLSPSQISEISRLIGAYTGGPDKQESTGEQQAQHELNAYLADLQLKNENLQPTTDKPTTPTKAARHQAGGGGGRKTQSPGKGGKSKKQTEQGKGKPQPTTQAAKTQAVEVTRKTAPVAGGNAGNNPGNVSKSAPPASVAAAPQKKMERKVAAASRQSAKPPQGGGSGGSAGGGSKAWK